MRSVILISTACFMLAGCGNKGEAGVDSDKQISALSAEELAKLCEWGVDIMAAIETEKCNSDSTTKQTGGPTSTTKSEGFENTKDEVENCKEELSSQFKNCAGTVEEIETCLTARSKSPCVSENDIPECKILMRCEDDDGIVPTTDGGMGSVWDSCYHQPVDAPGGYACMHSWRCPYGADRDLTCTSITDGYQCTCKNVKEGTEEGTFTSSDICGLESHNVAYRVNQKCGYQLPEN